MSNKRSKEIPDWWSPSLYAFLEEMPPAGWVWEFYRRAVLRENFGQQPIEAMNPNPDVGKLQLRPIEPLERNGWFIYGEDDEYVEEENKGKLNPAIPTLFYNWAHPFWKKRPPIGISPAVHCEEIKDYGRWFGRWHSVRRKLVGKNWLEQRHQQVSLRIDLDRFDAALKRDFEWVLAELRRKYPEPHPVKPKYDVWLSNSILQVWDLRELQVAWKTITDMFFKEKAEMQYDELHPARNAFKTAERYIDNGRWQELCRYVDWEPITKSQKTNTVERREMKKQYDDEQREP